VQSSLARALLPNVLNPSFQLPTGVKELEPGSPVRPGSLASPCSFQAFARAFAFAKETLMAAFFLGATRFQWFLSPRWRSILHTDLSLPCRLDKVVDGGEGEVTPRAACLVAAAA
jgi:hypothetical protein